MTQLEVPTSPLLEQRRAAAATRARELPLPTFRKRAGWEFTSLDAFDLELPLSVGGEPQDAPAAPELIGAGVVLTQVGDQVLVSGDLPEGVTVSTLDEAALSHPDVVGQHLGTVVDESDPFVARAEASWTGGAFVHIAAGTQVHEPIALRVHQQVAGHTQAWRVLVVIERGATAEVRELWDSGPDGGAGLLLPVCEILVGEGANLRYLSVQELSESTGVLGSTRARIAQSGVLDWAVLALGGGHGRIHLDTTLDGEGAEARVTGAVATRGRQHLDYATKQVHAAPRTNSDLAFRGILGGRSSTVWSGMIEVHKDAQKIDAFQESRNLLLTKKAHADAIPGLEILANDVRCTHAAAIAPLDPEQLFYLGSRGLNEAASKRLLIEGFLTATVQRFPEGAFRTSVATAIDRRVEAVLG
jgi:Fe-S cluster assembly protein SufD